MASVTFRHVCKQYDRGSAPAVNDFCLEVPDGEFLVLVGPSGCGKSTTLRMVAGLETPTSGEVLIGGKDVTNLPPKDRDIAMVFQNYALYPHMTVAENLGFALKLRGTPKAEIARRVDEVAETLGLKDYLKRLPKALSGGQRQRVALGRAIVRQPAVFLFDEPLSNLDAKMRVEMRSEIVRLHHRLGCTMLYVTHDQIEAMTMGDRIVVMNAGEVQQVDAPMNVYERPANPFVASFIGTPPMNLFPAGTIDKDRITGLRPEHIAVEPEECGKGIEAVVDIVEPLGSETLVHVRTTDGFSAVARLQGSARFVHGSRVRLVPDMSRAVHFAK